MTTSEPTDDSATADEAFTGALDTYRLPAESLAGETVALDFGGGLSLRLEFLDDLTVRWSSAELGVLDAQDPYDAVRVRDDVHFATVQIASVRADALTVVWSTTTGRALLAHTWIEPDAVVGRPRCSQAFHAGTVVGAGAPGTEHGTESATEAARIPGPTRDLIGARNLYRYGPDVAYEHVYLSSERYAWQCLQGPQAGAADVDLATVWSFGDDLYLFAFREFEIDVATVWLHDLGPALRTTGAFLVRGPEGQALHGKGGGHIRPLGRVTYPDAQPV